MKFRKTLLAFVWVLCLHSACGGNHTTGPTEPISTAASVVASTPSLPLVAVPDPVVPSRYRVTAQLVFRETAGRPVRITRLKVTVSTLAGWSSTVTDDCDLPVPAMGTASQTLTTVVDAGPDPVVLWRLTITAVDAAGKPSEINALEADLRLAAATSAASAIFVGAGDIARCDGSLSTAATAQLLARIPGTVFTLGDNVYPSSTPELLATCYGQTWGREKYRTLAAPGNHDWEQSAGAPYFSYFGASAGPAGLGYYSHTLGGWHIVSLNSNIPAGPGSPQYEWLKADLAQSGAACTLAMWHHPLFSSGPNGNSAQMREAWRLLNRFGADVVLSGHDHDYERFAPQDADGRATPSGIREFVVGTGGYGLYDRASQQPNSELWENRTWGVMKLTLKSGSYDWEFVPIDGQSFRDTGSGQCDNPRADGR